MFVWFRTATLWSIADNAAILALAGFQDNLDARMETSRPTRSLRVIESLKEVFGKLSLNSTGFLNNIHYHKVVVTNNGMFWTQLDILALHIILCLTCVSYILLINAWKNDMKFICKIDISNRYTTNLLHTSFSWFLHCGWTLVSGCFGFSVT